MKGPIQNYRVEWNAQRRTGVVRLRVWTGSWEIREFSIPVTNPQDMLLLVDLVRNEGPLSYDTETMTITTADEIVGEGEK